MTDKIALVLGGTNPHVELINKLKKRGYYVILVDYLNNSPGIAAADRHIKQSTLDKEKVLETARSTRAQLVISTCIDQANSVCCYVAEKLGLPRPYSYQTSLNVTDKGLMKHIMIDNDIPTSPYILTSSVEAIDWSKVKFPAVVKPVDCNSSKGVHRADSREEVVEFVREALRLSRAGQAIVEGFNEGDEIQVDCFAGQSGANVLMTRQKKRIIGGNGMVLQSTGSIVPAPLSDCENEQAKNIAVKIAAAFGLRNTPFFYQAIKNKNGIFVLEFAPRIGGGLSSYMLKEMAGFDSVETAIDSFLGNVNENDVKAKPIKRFYSTSLLYMKPGVFDRLEGAEQLKSEGVIKEYFQMKKKGTEIDSDMRSGNRVCAFVVEAESPEKVRELEREAYGRIKVIDADGNDALNRAVNF